jgi:uroporphyrinogen decarboxylase
MTSKERVYAAVHRRTLDRLPRFIWVGSGAAENLQRELNISKESIDDYMKNDVRQTWLSINKQMMTQCGEGEQFVDEWGITWQRDGYYNTPVVHPFADMTAAEIADAPFPDAMAAERYEELTYLLQTHKQHFIGADVSGTLFEPACHLRSMENFMVDLISGAEEADVLLDRLSEFSLKVSLEAARIGADWIWLGDDMGSQMSMLISPDTWRRYFKPRLQRLIASVRSQYPDMIFAYHSCGSICPIIGDLAEIGIDVLNPLQESAAGMEQRRIKEQYGDKLTLMCGLDTQSLLIRGTPREIYHATLAKQRQLAHGGGYIVAVSHTIQHDVPVDNIVAMLNALDDAASENYTTFG